MHWLLLGMVVVGAGALRFADLGGRPAGLFHDEAEKGYNAWALATSGGALEFTPEGARPIRWARLPFMIDVMGVRTSLTYQYASVPFMWAGGLTVATTRMAAAAAGTLAVLLVGWLMMRAWGPGIGVAAALWTALCPWHIVLSRWAMQSAFVPALTALVLFGLLGVEQRRRWGWPLAGAALGWLFYTYSGAQPLVLAWGACLLFIYRRELPRGGRPLALGAALFLLPVVPTVIVTLRPGGAMRWTSLSIADQPGATPFSVAPAFIRNYASHLNPVFLFWSGDINPRHGIPGAGQLAPVDLVLLPLGLIYSLRSRRPLAWAILAAWLCAPLPAALTVGPNPHALRSFGMALPSTIWSGAGLWLVADWVRRRSAGRRLDGLVWTAALAIGLSLMALYWKTYAVDERAQFAFDKGVRDSWTRVERERKPDQRVCISTDIIYAPYFQLFFANMPPRATAAEGLSRGGRYFYFDPRRTPAGEVMRGLRAGDWMIRPTARWAVRSPDDAFARIAEDWVSCEQKP